MGYGMNTVTACALGAIGGYLVLGGCLLWRMSRSGMVQLEYYEKLLELEVMPMGDDVQILEILKTSHGYTYRGVDGLSDETLYEGSGPTLTAAASEAGWQALRRALEG